MKMDNKSFLLGIILAGFIGILYLKTSRNDIGRYVYIDREVKEDEFLGSSWGGGPGIIDTKTGDITYRNWSRISTPDSVIYKRWIKIEEYQGETIEIVLERRATAN